MSSSSSPGLPHSRSISRTFSIQSIPRSVLSTPSSVGECSPPRGFVRGKCERVNMGSPDSVHSRTTSGDSLILLRHLRRQVSAASIPIFFDNISQPHLSTDDFEETLQNVSADEAQNVGKSLFVSPKRQCLLNTITYLFQRISEFFLLDLRRKRGCTKIKAIPSGKS